MLCADAAHIDQTEGICNLELTAQAFSRILLSIKVVYHLLTFEIWISLQNSLNGT